MDNYALTKEQLDQFNEDGYLILEGLFNTDEIERMQEESQYILKLIINSSLANKRLSSRMDWTLLPGNAHHVRKIQPINDLSLYFARISADARLIEPMTQIMGCKPVLMEEKLNYKQPLAKPIEEFPVRQSDDRFPIHHDWAYYAAQNYPQNILSSAISIDECTEDNGPLHVWPGSHKKHLEHEQCDLGLQVKPGLIDPDGGVDILAPAGSVMFFHSLLVHNSRPNNTPHPRRLMIYSHYPSTIDMGVDVRNGPTRLREAPYEHQYYRMKESGKYVDRFLG